MKTVAQKMGVKEGYKAYFKNAPAGIIESLGLPALTVIKRLSGQFDYIHLFVTHATGMAEVFPKLKEHLKPGGMFWVSWPKGGQSGTDLSLQKVIKIGYDFGLVESTALSVNAVWSALKFTHPKEGKTYNNSYGKLKKDTSNK